MKWKHVLVFAALSALYACGASLKTAPADLHRADRKNGTVIGSLVVKTKAENARLSASLVDKPWSLTLAPEVGGSRHSLSVRSDGKEVPFVSTLPPGAYVITRLKQTGLAPMGEVNLRVRFVVEGGATTYVGRLVLAVPDRASPLDAVLFTRRSVDVEVQDALEETLAALAPEYGQTLGEGVKKNLMTVARNPAPDGAAAPAPR